MKYCPDCGKKIDQDFRFCPTCGKDVKNSNKYCPECGKRLSSDSSFCNSCTGLSSSEKTPISQIKPKTGRKWLRWKFNISKKIAIIILILICVVVIGGALIVLRPFDLMNQTPETRTFTISIENTFTASSDCELIVNGLKYGSSFSVVSGESVQIPVHEEDVLVKRSSYPITLRTTCNEITLEATATNVTEYASFKISTDTPGLHTVECIDYL